MHQISAQEHEIMKIIWSAGSDHLTTRDIETRLFDIDGKKRNLSSLMTVIARLVDKNFLEPVKKYRKSTYFTALIEEREFKVYVTKQFIDGIHDGKLSGFVSALIDGGQYTQQDIEELRNMIDKIKHP